SGNPAGLAYLRSNAVVMDILPPFGTMASDFLDFEGIAADAIDDAVSDITGPGFEPTYPTIEAAVGQQGGVISGSVGIRLGRAVVAAAIEEPMSVALRMVDTGIEAYGHTIKDDGDDLIDIQVRCMVDAATDFAFEVDRTTLAAGSEVYTNVALGLSVSRYHGRAAASGNVRGDGIVSYGGQEYAFNDPSDPWDNELGMTMHGSYEGAAFGWNIGASWRPLDLLTVDASYASMPALELDGVLTTVTNVMPGLIDGEFDPDQILDSQPTLTERTETVEDDPVTLLLPSHAGVAVSLHAPFMLATLEYRRFTGAFGFEYQDVSEGVDVTDGLGLELDFGGVRLGGGFIHGKLMGDSLEGGSAGEDILIPLANLGLGIDIGQNMRLDTMVLAVPLQVLRLSLGYEF
ncbi:MAG: hypothetical protein U9Q95_05650, partial [Candidatus Eisenbacteria bacterium]|nr:hypothetical protein [Candidatus Eisenbacteria bacterium]